MTRIGGDSGGIVIGWLTRITVLFAVAGVVLFDAMALGTTHASVSDQANAAAREAALAYQNGSGQQRAYVQAVQVASEADSGNVIDPRSFRIDPDGTVRLRLSRDADTLVLYRIGPLEDWIHVEKEGLGRGVG
jgi:P pilus assembly chaperone PapD